MQQTISVCSRLQVSILLAGFPSTELSKLELALHPLNQEPICAHQLPLPLPACRCGVPQVSSLYHVHWEFSPTPYVDTHRHLLYISVLLC